MPDTDIGKTTTTDLTGGVADFSQPSKIPDGPSTVTKETYWDFPESNKYYGYSKDIPQYKAALIAMGTWVVGKGYTTESTRTKLILENLKGQGNDNAQSIFFNMQVMKKALGDSFAEIIRNDKGTLINLKPLYTGDMRVVFNNKGTIIRYEQRTKAKNNTFQSHQILHLSNDRMANEMHGTPAAESVKWIIDAKEEVMRDWRRVSHRSTIRVMYLDCDDTAKISTMKTQYKDAISDGELLIITVPRGAADLTDLTSPPIENFIRWIEYLDGLYYQTIGVPKIMVTSEGAQEAGSKVGYMTFDPSYSREQIYFEAALLNQVGIKVKFNRPPSLAGLMTESEEKNTGQVGIQPNDVTASATRTE